MKPIIYRATTALPPDVDVGDFVVVRPSDPIPVEIVKRRNRKYLLHLMRDGHLREMELLSDPSDERSESPLSSQSPGSRPRVLR